MRYLLVCWKNDPLVIIKVKSVQPIVSILDWYAEEYAFERDFLNATYIETVDMP